MKLYREARYYVIKLSDLDNIHLSVKENEALISLAHKLRKYRTLKGKPPLECVVVEKDWPEYEPTWRAIEARVNSEKDTSQKPTTHCQCCRGKNPECAICGGTNEVELD